MVKKVLKKVLELNKNKWLGGGRVWGGGTGGYRGTGVVASLQLA